MTIIIFWLRSKRMFLFNFRLSIFSILQKLKLNRLQEPWKWWKLPWQSLYFHCLEFLGRIAKLQMTSSWRPPATPGAKGSWTNAKSFTNVRVVDNLNGKSAWHTALTGTTAVWNVKYKRYHVDPIIF